MRTILVLALASLAAAHGPCQQSEWGNRGCDSSNVLWQCQQTSDTGYTWVVENDCAFFGYSCNAVAIPGASAGCQPPPPAGSAECTYGQYGSYQCDGQTLQQCAYDPWWITKTTCGAGYTCFASTSGFANCVPIGIPVAGSPLLAGSNSGTTSTTTAAAAAATSSSAATAGTVSAGSSPDLFAPASVASSQAALSGGAIAGITIAGVAVVAAIGAAFVMKSGAAKTVATETLAPTGGLLSA